MNPVDLTGMGPQTYALLGGSGEAEATDHPFRLHVRLFGSGVGAVWKRGVSLDSELLKSPDYADRQEITGLLTSADPADDDAGWAPIKTSGTDRVWLEMPVNFPTITGGAIKSEGAEDEWGGGAVEHVETEDEPPAYRQTKARYLIGIITPPAEAGQEPLVKQFARTYLTMKITPMMGRDEDGENPQPVHAVYPRPY